MSVMDKLMNAMKFNDDDEEEFGEEELDEEYYDGASEEAGEAERTRPVSREPETEAPQQNTQGASRLRRRSAERTDPEPVRQRRRDYTDSTGQVCIIRPTSVNDAREVTDTLLEGSTVVLNLEGLDVEIAQRIIDFTSGSCYAVGGNVQKISHYIFVITPSNVDVSGDISARETIEREAGSSLRMNFGSGNGMV